MGTPVHPGRSELLRHTKYQVEGSAYCTVPPTILHNRQNSYPLFYQSVQRHNVSQGRSIPNDPDSMHKTPDKSPFLRQFTHGDKVVAVKG